MVAELSNNGGRFALTGGRARITNLGASLPFS